MNHETNLQLPLQWGSLEVDAICSKTGYVVARLQDYGLSKESWNFLMHAANCYQFLIEALLLAKEKFVGESDSNHFISKALENAGELTVLQKFKFPLVIEKNLKSDFIIVDQDGNLVCIIPGYKSPSHVQIIKRALENENTNS